LSSYYEIQSGRLSYFWFNGRFNNYSDDKSKSKEKKLINFMRVRQALQDRRTETKKNFSSVKWLVLGIPARPNLIKKVMKV
jgi:hypothetical protein